MVDRQMLLDHLAQAERHVSEGERHVAHQRQIVADLERDGHDAQSAHALLAQFEDLLRMHIEDRDRIKGEIAALE